MSDDRSDGDDAPESDPFEEELLDDGPDDETDDPFAEPDGDEVDDPFAALGEGVDETAPDADADPAADAPSSDDPAPGAPADDPFAELGDDAGGEATEEDPFESMEVGDVGEEDVWDALDGEGSIGGDAAEFDAGTADGETGDSTARSGEPWAPPGSAGDERVVDKRSYCQQCPHFSAPPETACTHEGTDIVESVDFSRFRVRNCPMVDADDPAFDGE